MFHIDYFILFYFYCIFDQISGLTELNVTFEQ